LQAHRNLAKVVKCRLQILYGFGGDLFARCQQVVVFERTVLEPESVEITLFRASSPWVNRRKRSDDASARRQILLGLSG
jgi:hypothetical protein